MVLKGVLRDVHVFAFIYHKCSPALSLWVNGRERERKKLERRRENNKRKKSPPKIKKLKKGKKEERTV